MLQRQEADWSDFARGTQAFQALLTDGQYNAFALESTGFEGLNGLWGTSHKQEDAHEFTNTLLEWSQSMCIDVTWSRRYTHQGSVWIHDNGSWGMPPTLTVGACEKGETSLQQLLEDWHNHAGMKTCFHVDADLMGLHFDRLTRNSQGEVCRADWIIHLESFVTLPFWMNDHTMLPYRHEYIPVAALLHQGGTQSGHLQAALWTSEGWFITDDGKVAQPEPRGLQPYLQDICYVWLAKHGVFNLARIAEPLYGKDDWVLKVAWYLHHELYAALKQDQTVLHIMRSSCADCGAPIFGAVGFYAHMEHHHPGLLLGIRIEYQRLILELNEVNVPCGLCLAKPRPDVPFDPDARMHTCHVCMNLALANLYYYNTLSPAGNRYLLPPADDPGMAAGPTALLPMRDILDPPDRVSAFLEALMRLRFLLRGSLAA